MAHCLKHKGNYSDEFWMLSFKVVPCTKTYAHSWSSCPCAHPGETARRRDPTLFNYQPVLCPNVKSKSGCPSGDSCGYAHNVFEQWLHPQRYKALMCTYGSQCTRPSCFFAHSLEELRVPWKGGTGNAAGAEQQQAQQAQQQGQRGPGSSGPQSEGDGASGLGLLGCAAGTSSSEPETTATAAATAAAVRSASVTVPGHAAAAAAGVVGGGPGGSGRPRLVMQAASGLQQQLQQMQSEGLLGGGGGGTHSVVDVRVVAASGIGQSLSSDHALIPSSAQSFAVNQSRFGMQGIPGSGATGAGQQQHRGSASTSVPYDLDTATSIPVDSTSFPLVSGQQNQLFRTQSNGSTQYAGLTEEVLLTAGGPTGHSGAHAPLAVVGPSAPGGTTDVALVQSESTSAASLYHTPTSTSQHQLTVSGLASVGIYVGGGSTQGGTGGTATAGGGGSGSGNPSDAMAGSNFTTSTVSGQGVGVPGGRPLPLGAPQLQQHLQQLQQLQHQQQQQLQAQRLGGQGGGSAGTSSGCMPGGLSSGATGRMHQTPGQLPQQQQLLGPFHSKPPLPGQGSVSGNGGSGPAGWLPQAQQQQQQQSSGIEFVQASGGTASLDFTGPPHSSTMAMHSSSNIMDISEDIEPSGAMSGWVSIPLPQGGSAGQLQLQPPKQGLALGSFGASSSHRANLPPRSFSAVLPDETAATTAAMQQLHVSGTGATGLSQSAQPQQQTPGVFTEGTRPGFRRHSSLHLSAGPATPAVTPPAATPPADMYVTVAAAAAARIDPDVEMLLLSSLQLQLTHAGVAGHPAVASFPVQQWLRQALQGRAQAATRAYLFDLLAQYMPTEQLSVIRRLLECLDEAGTLLSCFAGPAVAVPTGPGGMGGGGLANTALGGGPGGPA